MKLAVVGATGNIGKQIIVEALTRGHEVTAIVRDASRVETTHENLHVVTGTDQLLTDENGESRVSIPNYTVALLDEVETPQFLRQRFTVRNA